MLLTRRLAGLLLLAGAFQWLVWPNFLRVVWRDDRAFDAAGAPTAFLLVHVAIVVPALLLGTALLWLGVVAWRRAPRAGAAGSRPGAAVDPATRATPPTAPAGADHGPAPVRHAELPSRRP